MENTDKSLIEAHCKGDKTAFSELVRRYGDSILGYLMRMSWLFTIATNLAIDGMRRRRRMQVVSLNQRLDCTNQDGEELSAVALADDSYEPSQEAAKAEQVEKVREAIESLPARQRATLVLAYYQQLSYPEVAKVMGCSLGTVKTQMYRALRALAQKLPDV
jgi:RNA polymerase sigma-70 factor (ECF subfamily)